MIVYRHIRLDTNEVFYIGIGHDISRAFSKQSRNRYWKSITNLTPYTTEVIFECLTWDEACKKEIELIKLYGRKDLGLGTLVNMTDGGEGHVNMSPELRTRYSNLYKGKSMEELYGTYRSKEILKKKSAGGKKGSKTRALQLKGKPAYNKGIPRPDSVKNLISSKLKGTIMSDDVKEKISKSLKGRHRTPFTDSTRKAMSNSAKLRVSKNGNNNASTYLNIYTGTFYETMEEYLNLNNISRYKFLKGVHGITKV